MSIWNVDAFCNSPFKETVVYTPTGQDAITIEDAVLNRGVKESTSFRSVDQRQSKYDVTLMVRRTYVTTVTENKDRVSATDHKGQSKEYFVKEILECNPESWILGLS